MGIADRDYTMGRGRVVRRDGRLTPVVRWLIGVNLGVFFADILFLDHRLLEWGAFRIETALWQGRVWEFLTFQVLHGSVLHLLFNSVGLYFFGPWMERWWGAARFLVFYLCCGASGAAFYTLLWWVGMFPGEGAGTGLIGASAGIYGILMGVALIAPGLRVALLFPPVELSMRQLALLILGLAVVSVVTGWGGNAGGEAGHLGGAILGWLLVRRPGLLSWVGGGDRGVEVLRPRVFGGGGGAKLAPRTRVDLGGGGEVDRILDKISQHGFQSLTDEERAVLQAAAEANRRRSDE